MGEPQEGETYTIDQAIIVISLFSALALLIMITPLAPGSVVIFTYCSQLRSMLVVGIFSIVFSLTSLTDPL